MSTVHSTKNLNKIFELSFFCVYHTICNKIVFLHISHNINIYKFKYSHKLITYEHFDRRDKFFFILYFCESLISIKS